MPPTHESELSTLTSSIPASRMQMGAANESTTLFMGGFLLLHRDLVIGI